MSLSADIVDLMALVPPPWRSKASDLVVSIVKRTRAGEQADALNEYAAHRGDPKEATDARS